MASVTICDICGKKIDDPWMRPWVLRSNGETRMPFCVIGSIARPRPHFRYELCTECAIQVHEDIKNHQEKFRGENVNS